MRHALLSLCIFHCSILFLYAADNYPVGARAAGIANASVTLTDAWACFHNQAGLAYLKNTVTGASFDNRFSISDLSTKGFVFASPLKAGTFGLSASVFGYSKYNEKKAGFTYAKKFGEKVSAGLQLDYLNTFIGDEYYGSKSSFVVEGGLLTEPIKDFKLGFHIFNPTRAKLAEYADERIPTIVRVGVSYTFSEKVFWNAEEEKDIDQQAIFKSGIEYHINEPLFLRVGISTNPTLVSFGFGIRMKQLSFDAASSYHQVLGFSSSFSLNYEFQ
jgi:hypothetical protein